MANIVRAVAFANNEIAFLTWEIDQDAIPGSLGFHFFREYLDANDQVVDERPLAWYVAFKGQRNPDWLPHNTTVWPVQKFNWRDLTLRKRRDSATRRRVDDRVRYLIRAVGGADRQGDRQAAGRLSVRRKADCRPRHHPRQLDPTDPVHCTVAFGSHNLSYKASYSNDENLVVVRGHRDLALAYAAHVLDVFDHYRFRAVEAELAKKGGSADKRFDGLLKATDGWQTLSSHRLSRYLTEIRL
jgi:hypothetical protein